MTRKFRTAWLEMPDLKTWLVPPTQTQALPSCKVCHVSFKRVLLDTFTKHGRSTSHVELCKSVDMTRKIDFPDRDGGGISHPKQVAKAELSLLGFFLEHHIPLHRVDHLVKIVSKISPENKVAQNLRLGAIRQCTPPDTELHNAKGNAC